MIGSEQTKKAIELINTVGHKVVLKALIEQAQDCDEQIYAIRLGDALITLLQYA